MLSRDVAAEGLYPAVDPLASSSKALDPSIVGQRHYDVAQHARRVLGRYEELKDLISMLGIDELSAKIDSWSDERGGYETSSLNRSLSLKRLPECRDEMFR